MRQSLRLSLRQWILYGALVGTVAAVAWQASEAPAGAESDMLVPLSERAARARASAKNLSSQLPPTLALESLQRQADAEPERNPFAMTSWYTPAPAPAVIVAVAAAPEKPTAPALPYAYMGKLEQDAGQWIFYLVKGEQSFAVSKGETFDNIYRFEGIEQGKLAITYLPLSLKQWLPIGAAAEESYNSEKD